MDVYTHTQTDTHYTPTKDVYAVKVCMDEERCSCSCSVGGCCVMVSPKTASKTGCKLSKSHGCSLKANCHPTAGFKPIPWPVWVVNKAVITQSGATRSKSRTPLHHSLAWGPYCCFLSWGGHFVYASSVFLQTRRLVHAFQGVQVIYSICS